MKLIWHFSNIWILYSRGNYHYLQQQWDQQIDAYYNYVIHQSKNISRVDPRRWLMDSYEGDNKSDIQHQSSEHTNNI